MRSVRIWFTKCDTAKYISHLDLTRCFIRAFRRTDIPLWYTEGFNPHPHLVFGLSLPLGAEGLNEAFDIRLDDDSYPDEKILESLNAVTVNGIKFLKTAEPVYKPLEIEKAEYDFIFESDNVPAAVLLEQLKSRLDSGEVFYEKKTKKKDPKLINICDYIENPQFTLSGETVMLNIFLPAGNAFTINPIHFCAALTEETDCEPSNSKVIRKNLFVKNGEIYR